MMANTQDSGKIIDTTHIGLWEPKLDKAWANSFGPMEVFMKGGSTITKQVEKADQWMQLEMFTWGYSKKMSAMVKEFTFGLTVSSIKENSVMERNMDKESITI